ncbi:hypothetical protein K7W42_07765 [Deinococcus sp. HMF7604]|uniref:hypothetical protein n=1 Tax=Deinococcus betulae TaxID=2873312 RepID=UPI001CCC5596|nr:hypothetical protein [Deinococcus betulae]MBZ9750756.1 hypothetical protein [Deinococcus betulae]
MLDPAEQERIICMEAQKALSAGLTVTDVRRVAVLLGAKDMNLGAQLRALACQRLPDEAKRILR